MQLKIVLDNGETIPGMDYDGPNLSFQRDHGIRMGEIEDLIKEVLRLAIKYNKSTEHGRVFDCVVLRKSITEDGVYEGVALVTCITTPDHEGIFNKITEVTII